VCVRACLREALMLSATVFVKTAEEQRFWGRWCICLIQALACVCGGGGVCLCVCVCFKLCGRLLSGGENPVETHTHRCTFSVSDITRHPDMHSQAQIPRDSEGDTAAPSDFPALPSPVSLNHSVGRDYRGFLQSEQEAMMWSDKAGRTLTFTLAPALSQPIR
jgi:hypothetical protein